MIEWAGVGALAGLAVACVVIVTFWINLYSRLTKAEADAEAAKKSAAEAHEKIALQAASFSLYREQVAREYIHREVMREVEDRLTAAIDRLGERLDRVLEARQRSP